ncbi:MAG: hypothetical protein ACOYXT_11810 [Bacteroidota bacterium]
MVSAGKISFSLGNIFETPGEILVIPRNSDGGISNKIEEGLKKLRIPYAPRKTEAGAIDFLTSSAKQYSMIAFVTTVAQPSAKSSVDIIKLIGDRLGSYVNETALRVVVSPLLGTGAGGLDPVDAFVALQDSFAASSPSDGKLNVVILEQEHYEAISLMSQTQKDEGSELRKETEMSLTPSVEGALKRTPGNTTALELIAEILTNHPEYGGNSADDIRKKILQAIQTQYQQSK